MFMLAAAFFDIGASLVYAGAEFDFDDGGDVYVGDSVCI